MKIFLFFVIIVLSINAFGTINDLNSNSDSVLLTAYLKQLEKELNIKIFYHTEWTDSIYFKKTDNNENLAGLLTFIDEETNLSYIQVGSVIVLSANYTFSNALSTKIFEFKRIDSLNRQLETSFFDVNPVVPSSINQNIIIGNPARKYINTKAILTGNVTEANTNLAIIGAVIYSRQYEIGTTTDYKGNYTIELPKGKHQLEVSLIGKKDKFISLVLHESGSYSFSLDEDTHMMDDIVISAEQGENIERIEQGIESIDIKKIKKLPTTLGEADIIKTALLLPGIQSTGEGNSGFNVRGGSADQNLILLDGSTIYNPSHLLGFFSALNPDVIDDFKIYKSSFPAQYGGRLSSVVDIQSKRGNKEKLQLNGGVSPITARLAIQGPIVKDRVSVLIAGRSTYSEWLLKQIKSPVVRASQASFYDINLKLFAKLTESLSMDVAAYQSNDSYKLNSDTLYSYANKNLNFGLEQRFKSPIRLRFNMAYSGYDYNIQSDTSSINDFTYFYNINQLEENLSLSYVYHANHQLKVGLSSIQYDLNPGELIGQSIVSKKLEKERGIENAFFISDQFDVNTVLSFDLGFRYSQFYSLGPGKIKLYDENSPKSESSITGELVYGDNEIMQKYSTPELRLSSRLKLGRDQALKASYSQMSQYIHMLSNTYSVSPTDAWTLSNYYIKPQTSSQYALGFYKDMNNGAIETSVETYYKKLNNLLEYKAGASLFLNENLETEMLTGEGRSYGVELVLKKKEGRMHGWASYTYSRSLVKVDGRFKEETINNGKFFPTNYDKPHDLTLVLNYDYSRRISFSSVIVYNTGRPITYPESKYQFGNREYVHYSERNAYRIPDYFRMDVSLTIDNNLKLTKRFYSAWTFSVYNLTGRNNAYSIYFDSKPNQYVKGYKMSIFAQPIPTITYNFKI